MNKSLVNQMFSLLVLCATVVITGLSYTQFNQQLDTQQQMATYIENNSNLGQDLGYYTYESEWHFRQVIDETFAKAENISVRLGYHERRWIDDIEVDEFVYEVAISGDLLDMRNCIAEILEQKQVVNIHEISVDYTNQYMIIKLSLYNEV